MEKRDQRQHLDGVSSRVTFVSNDDLIMTERDNIVRVTLTSTNTSTITLPSVGENRGRAFVIKLDAVGTGRLTLQDKGDDANFTTMGLGVAGTSIVVESTGEIWEVLHDGGVEGQFSVFDDFTYQASHTEADKPWILNSGADAQALDPVITAGANGTIRLTTGNADGTTANDASQMVCNVPMRADSVGLYAEARLKCVTNIATMSVFFGFTDSTSLEEAFTNSADTITSTATDACGFLYDTDATTDEWWAVAVDTDVDDTGNATTGVAPVADTYQVLRVEVSADGNTIKFYINGTLVATRSAGGVSPDASLYATVIACATTTTSKSVDVDYIDCGHARR
jgi:hypothetical protein